MSDLPAGQILPESEFGRLLTNLARDACTIVEIGSWFGGGSTQCFADALGPRPKKPTGAVLWCVECDWVKCDAIRKRFRDHPRWRTIVVIENTALMAVACDCLPSQIDLLLLDGDELSTDAEFDALWDRCTVIALDDTNERKNKRQRQLLIDWGWDVIADNPKERNGYAVFRRPTT